MKKKEFARHTALGRAIQEENQGLEDRKIMVQFKELEEGRWGWSQPRKQRVTKTHRENDGQPQRSWGGRVGVLGGGTFLLKTGIVPGQPR